MKKVRVSLVFPEDLYLDLKRVAEENAESLSSLVVDALRNLYDGDYVALRKDVSEELDKLQLSRCEAFELVNNILRKYFDGCLVEVPYDRLGAEGGSAAVKESEGLLMIKTLEGVMRAYAGKHYVVRGIRNEFYAVDKEIFEATYEE